VAAKAERLALSELHDRDATRTLWLLSAIATDMRNAEVFCVVNIGGGR
jgi:hypothetical protein